MNDHLTHTAGHGAHPDAPPTGRTGETGPALASETPQSSRGHRLMMMVMCVPMLVIVAVLVATGVAGAGAVVYRAALRRDDGGDDDAHAGTPPLRRVSSHPADLRRWTLRAQAFPEIEWDAERLPDHCLWH